MKTSTIWVKLSIEHEHDDDLPDILRSVDQVLDQGTFQDEVLAQGDVNDVGFAIGDVMCGWAPDKLVYAGASYSKQQDYTRNAHVSVGGEEQ